MLNEAENGAKNWASNLGRNLLNNHGFTYVWERQHVLDFNFMFKKRVKDEFSQKNGIMIRTRATIYRC